MLEENYRLLTDLCVILFNLLDNAMEGYLRYIRQTGGQPRIEVTIHRIYQFLIIEVLNPCIPPRKLFGIFPTTKADARHHGIGLRNVREKVEKYNASLSPLLRNDRCSHIPILLFRPAAL